MSNDSVANEWFLPNCFLNKPLLYTFFQKGLQQLFLSLWNLPKPSQRRKKTSAWRQTWSRFRRVRVKRRSSFSSLMIQSQKGRKCSLFTSVIQKEEHKSQTVQIRASGPSPRSLFSVLPLLFSWTHLQPILIESDSQQHQLKIVQEVLYCQIEIAFPPLYAL